MNDANEHARSRPWLLISLFALAATFVSFGILEYRQKSRAWTGALAQHDDCIRQLKQIQRLETVPRFAVLNADSPEAISARIEQAASATLPADALVAIQPESGRRAGNSSYTVNPTLIQLQGVTIPEIASFAASLEDAGQGLVVSELRLMDVVPGNGNRTERWTSDLKLTQTIFSANVSRQ